LNRKIISAVAWAISSCLFLWLFSLVQGNGGSNPPTPKELFESFLLFSFMLLGGGACYHFLTEIALSPLNPENSLWMGTKLEPTFTAIRANNSMQATANASAD